MRKIITPSNQRHIIEGLYRSDDSLASTQKFNAKHGGEITQMGKKTLDAREFAREMKKSGYKTKEIENFTKKVTGHDIDLESL